MISERKIYFVPCIQTFKDISEVNNELKYIYFQAEIYQVIQKLNNGFLSF